LFGGIAPVCSESEDCVAALCAWPWEPLFCDSDPVPVVETTTLSKICPKMLVASRRTHLFVWSTYGATVWGGRTTTVESEAEASTLHFEYAYLYYACACAMLCVQAGVARVCMRAMRLRGLLGLGGVTCLASLPLRRRGRVVGTAFLLKLSFCGFWLSLEFAGRDLRGSAVGRQRRFDLLN